MTCGNFRMGVVCWKKRLVCYTTFGDRNDEAISKQLPGRGSMVAGCTDKHKVWWEF